MCVNCFGFAERVLHDLFAAVQHSFLRPKNRDHTPGAIIVDLLAQIAHPNALKIYLWKS